jgi:dinuclear metal center YbgI/SA1388 family protein
LIGRPSDPFTNVLVALDLTAEVAEEAVRKHADLIVTHHPLLFRPLRTLTPSTRAGALALMLAQNNVALYAAHTNLDSVPWGVNFSLAAQLGLTDVQVLSPLKESLTNITIFVPNDHTEQVATAMHSAGGGTFTKYDTCSFRSEGTGTFRGRNGAQPFIGSVGVTEQVKESRLEMLAEHWKVNDVVAAMLKAHPYEEVAYTVTPLKNSNTEYGLGAIGTLPKAVPQRTFLAMVKKRLGCKVLRYSGNADSIRRVAVCGGSGSEFIRDAAAQKADAMVTADVKYHTFQDHEEDLLLVDAGHYETESGVLDVLRSTIAGILAGKGHKGKVFITQHSTNPVHIF